MSSCCCLTSLLIVVFVAHSLAHTPTESSSDAIHDVPTNNGSNGAEHGEHKDSYSGPHCHPVNNHIQIQGCYGHGDHSSTAANDKLLNLTGTILDILQSQEQGPRPEPILGNPRDCAEIQASGVITSGMYPIYPDGDGDPFFVSCDMETDGGGWTVFQRRQDGSVDFFIEWADYKYGFGSVSSEHWLGNDNIHRLAIQKTYELRVDLEDFTGQARYASYSTFYVADEAAEYTMTLGNYSGDAGDSLSRQSGRSFSTKDSDNDAHSGNCASIYTGAWWYANCLDSNLNGRYLHGQHSSETAQGVVWSTWLGYHYSLKKTEMKIRPM